MHPAFSVIIFSTVSGIGYGLLALVGVLTPLHLLPEDPLFGFAALFLALGAVTVGLLSSMFHLGQRARAWRAFSQWRTSWLSREGVSAVATYVPAGLFGLAWVFWGKVSGIAGVLAAIGAVGTVYCTSMIYRSLKTVPRWHNQWVVPNYFGFALMSGTLWLAVLLQIFGPRAAVAWLAIAAVVLSAALKLGYWRFIDSAPACSTAESATGLGALGQVRSFETPHTSENYLMKEMGFQIARKHAAKLRRIATVLAFVLPLLLSLVPLVSTGGLAILASLLAAALGTVGVLVERWLFFAEAKHVVTLFYGASSV